jgi:hypothetical protein
VQGPGLAKHPGGLWYGWAGQSEVWSMDLDARVLTRLPAGTLAVPEGAAINKGVYGRWAFDITRGVFFGIAHVDRAGPDRPGARRGARGSRLHAAGTSLSPGNPDSHSWAARQLT